LFSGFPHWIDSVVEISLPTLGAMIIVLCLEFLIQDKDNSWNALNNSKGKFFDIFSICMFIFRIHPILMDLILVGVLVKLRNWAKINSLSMYLDNTLITAVLTLVISLLVYDFLLYWSHRLKHNIDGLWFAHRFHHSTTDLNAFSFIRVHTLDYPFRAISVTIPMLFIAGVSFENLAWLWFAESISDILCHSRLNTGYKILGKVFVSPRFHRRHHDIDDHHCNYGLIFSFWDRVFGTYKNESDAFSRQTGSRQLPDSDNVVKTYLNEYIHLGKWCVSKLVKK
jgi:sterol desaturase/sphingolipid hydroxylase (fatty acid hydroxylase superfamily)